MKNFSFNFISRLATAVVYSCIITAPSIGQAEDATQGPGVGPIKTVDLKALDPALAAKGKEVFSTKCAACHKLGERYVGPDLAGVTKRRSPAWIMNMILNPQEMTQKDPIAQELYGEFLIQMTFQNVSEGDSRAILEYFRQHDSK